MTEHLRQNYQDWNIDTIERRSEELADISVDIWKF